MIQKYFTKQEREWYNIAKGDIIPRPFDPSEQRGNFHFKWCASPRGAIAKLWYNIAKGDIIPRPFDPSEQRGNFHSL